MTKKNAPLLVFVAVLLVGAGVWLGMFLARVQRGTSHYVAVYLTTGEVYFGKLSWFPLPHLDNVWFLSRGLDEQNRPQSSVIALRTLFWKPSDRIYFNPKQVVFVTRLGDQSEITKIFEKPSLLETPQPSSPRNP